MKQKKTISMILSAVLFAGCFGISAYQTDGSFLFTAPVTAEAAGTISSGQTGVSYKVSNNVTLYFYPRISTHEFELCGSKITGSNVAVTIPDTVSFSHMSFTVTKIRDNAFKDQTNLGSIDATNLCDTLTYIGSNAFSGCTNLTAVNITNRYNWCEVDYIGDYAFYGCSSLAGINFASNADYIGAWAFSECTSLDYVELRQAQTIGNGAFSGCYNVHKLELSQTTVPEIPALAFYGCSGANEIHLPETVTYLGFFSFCGCSSLELIYIPDAVTGIEYMAFKNCAGLKNVLMSKNISYIGYSAFEDCTSMKYFVCKNPNANITGNAIGFYYDANGSLQRNYNLVLWGCGGTIRDYANSNGFTYRNTSTASSQARSAHSAYEWRANNTAVNWAKNGKYYFNYQHMQYSGGKQNDAWAGICSGMAIVSVLTQRGYLSVSEYAPGYSRLRDIPRGSSLPDFTKSYVTTVWANQGNDEYWTQTGDNGICEFSPEMLKLAEYITYGAGEAVFTIGNGSSVGHAIVCYGMEFKEDAADRYINPLWTGKDARLLLYDVNRTAASYDDFIYVNLSDGSWSASSLASAGYGSDPSRFSFGMLHSIRYMTSYGSTDEFFSRIRY